MKRQSICAWAIVIAFGLALVAAPQAQAGTSKEIGSVRIVEQVKGKPAVGDAVGDNTGDPEVQYGDPDDLGGGDGKSKPQPPIWNPSGSGGNTSGSLTWYQAMLLQLVESLRFTLAL